MNKKKIKHFIILAVFCSLFQVYGQETTKYSIIPLTEKLKPIEGEFIIDNQTVIFDNSKQNKADASLFIQSLNDIYQIKPVLINTKPKSNFLQIDYCKSMQIDAYKLEVNKNNIKIRGGKNGVFYAFQSLLQLVKKDDQGKISIPCVKIKDKPRFQWRGMHLDVSRHFFSKDVVKKYIGRMAFYKMNTFHWHLTDDQGWRIEIKKYPLLTQKGSWRKGTVVGHAGYSKTFDTIPYGGFYTQDDIREIVAYATERHINIVPEIEMPGHAVAALSAYPQFSCKGNVNGVEKNWGVFNDVFCSKEETFTFLQDILDEVITLFPSKVIHIGGDECPKEEWKKCSVCQANMKKMGLKDEMQLQSYFIQRIEKYLNSKGRTIIGWDEILEGGLAPNAMVMSWRGTEGGIEAAHLKHDVVMTPGKYCYFDHYQSDPEDEPLAIGGFTTVSKIHEYDPAPKTLPKNVRKYIKGVQGNVWTEYIPSDSHLEYMVFPRLLSMAEIQWTTVKRKSYPDFAKRLTAHYSLFNKLGINASMSFFDTYMKIEQNKDSNGIVVSLSNSIPDSKIKYTLLVSKDNIQQNAYSYPIYLTENCILKYNSIIDSYQGKSKTIKFNINKATGKPLIFIEKPSKYYGDGSGFCLVDGIVPLSQNDNKRWMTWSDNNAEIISDLKSTQTISSVSIATFTDTLRHILKPKTVKVFVSENGNEYNEVKNSLITFNGDLTNITFDKENNIRYVKIIAENAGKIKLPNSNKEEYSWIFIGEIIIE